VSPHDPSLDPDSADPSEPSEPSDLLAGRSVLLTGAAGVVGRELADQLREGGGDEIVLSSRQPDEVDVVAWDMGREPPPPPLRRHFDVVIHAAARTRWSQTPDEAEHGNLVPARALADVVDAHTHLVFLSTAHAIGTTGSSRSDDLGDYRNPYEWSKARAERHVAAVCDRTTVVRFPMVVGRRSDGRVSRFSGFYKVLNGLCTGLLPAIVGDEEAPLDLVPVDDLARRILAIAGGGHRPDVPLLTIAGGPRAPRVQPVLDLVFDTLDQWRDEHGVAPLPRPPLLTPERWDRFFWPFARDELSPLQLRAVELFLEFRPYLSMPAPFASDLAVDDVLPALRRSLRWWAGHHPRVALAVPEAWTAP
jgi:nucleoside-diphosphate-sugar epimerase